jgi:hypothetical protein
MRPLNILAFIVILWLASLPWAENVRTLHLEGISKADSPERVTVTPSPLTEILPNLFKGFAAQNTATEAENNELPQSLFYTDVTWAALQRKENIIEWSVLENGWQEHFAQGRRVGFRFKRAEPIKKKKVIKKDMDIPLWLINKCAIKMTQYKLNDGGVMKYGYMPDWDNSCLLQEHDKLLQKFGERYGQDSHVAWVDVGSYGFWGEWHLFENEGHAAKLASRIKILESYVKHLGTRKLIIAFDDADASQFIAQNGHGLRHDCVGSQNKSFTDSLLRLKEKGVDIDNLYTRGVFSGEVCSAKESDSQTDIDVIHWLKSDPAKFRARVLDFVKAYHFSWLGPAGASYMLRPQSANERALVAELYKALGYHFWIKELSHEKAVAAAGSIRIDARIANDGSAPFYYNWPVEFALLDADNNIVLRQELSGWDVRTWLPGDHDLTAVVNVPPTIPAGKYTVSLAILDPNNQQPAVRFANSGLNKKTLRSEISALSITN